MKHENWTVLENDTAEHMGRCFTGLAHPQVYQHTAPQVSLLPGMITPLHLAPQITPLLGFAFEFSFFFSLHFFFLFIDLFM